MRVKLSDITQYSKGVQINGDDLVDNGNFIYLNGGINPSGRWTASNVDGNTITISEGGNSSGYINYITEPFWCGAHCYYLFDGPTNTKYMYYALKSQQERLFSIRTGACMPNIKKSDLGKFEFEFDFDEKKQNEVVSVLSSVESVIDSRKRELELLDELIKARFVEMFGDAVDNPMRWPVQELQEIVTNDCTISYGIVQTGDDQDEGIPVFRPVDIVNHVPVRSELKKTTEEISNKYKRTILKGRELLITVRANIADTCIVDEEFAGCNVGRGIVPIRTDENVMILEFLKHQLDSKHLNDNIRAMAKGITLIQLNMEDLRTVKLMVPQIEQQKAFVVFAEQIDKLKVATQKALDEAQLLFDSLMQEYFG